MSNARLLMRRLHHSRNSASASFEGFGPNLGMVIWVFANSEKPRGQRIDWKLCCSAL